MLTSSRMPVVGDVLDKIGCKTGRTQGIVDGDGRYRVRHQLGEQMVEGFKLVQTEEGKRNGVNLSVGGDSGSIWFDATTNEAVGLHWGLYTGVTTPLLFPALMFDVHRLQGDATQFLRCRVDAHILLLFGLARLVAG